MTPAPSSRPTPADAPAVTGARRDVLPPLDAAGRAARVRRALAEDRAEVPALFVPVGSDLRWLTGFGGSAGWAVVLPDRLVVGTDHRYGERLRADLAAAGVEAEVVLGRTRPEQDELLAQACRGLDRVGVDPGSVTHARWAELVARLPVVPAAGVVARCRRAKDPGEIARIELACGIADEALATVAPRLGDGLTETDVRDELEYLMRRLGADGPSYPTIVASGPEHAARPHHEPVRRRLDAGDTVIIDVGALVDGLHSDMTRSYVLGDPTAEQQEVYDLVLSAQLAGLTAVRAGAISGEVDAACRELFAAAGRADWYLHSTGHGVGLDIHEDPFHAPGSTAVLVAGDVVTVEPGLYRSGFGGFRVEDLVVVTDTGCRILTQTPKDSPCLPSPPTT
jgi:Xaa-Pro aminopeptidase